MKTLDWLQLPWTVIALPSTRVVNIVKQMVLVGWTVEHIKRPSIRYQPKTVQALAEISVDHLMKFPSVGLKTARQIHAAAAAFVRDQQMGTNIAGGNYIRVDEPFHKLDFAPAYLRTAARMLSLIHTRDIPPALATRLNSAAKRVQTAGGTLMSRQVIAAIIDQWEHYPVLYTPDRRPTDPQGNRVMFDPANPPTSQIEPDFTDEGDK